MIEEGEGEIERYCLLYLLNAWLLNKLDLKLYLLHFNEFLTYVIIKGYI